MTDVDDDSLPQWTEEELAVLRSANADAPGPRSLAATLAAVGTGAAVASSAVAAKAGASAGSASAKWGGTALVAKWFGGLLLGGAVVTSGVVLLRERASSPVLVPKPIEARPVVAPTPPVVDSEPPAPSKESESVEAAPPAAGPAPAPPASADPRRVPAQPDISLEIAALDGVRRDLRSGKTTEALAALDRYDQGVGRRGSLRVEATTLRIEALQRSGNHARAVSLANAFLARNGKSPYAARVRALVFGDSASK